MITSYTKLSVTYACVFSSTSKVNIAITKVAKADVRIGKTTTIIICHVDRCWYKRNTSPKLKIEPHSSRHPQNKFMV